MMRAMFLGSPSSAARALLTASVSGSERYSTPSGDRYCTGCALGWPASSESPSAIAAAIMDVNAARQMSLRDIGRILLERHTLRDFRMWSLVRTRTGSGCDDVGM